MKMFRIEAPTELMKKLEAVGTGRHDAFCKEMRDASDADKVFACSGSRHKKWVDYYNPSIVKDAQRRKLLCELHATCADMPTSIVWMVSVGCVMRIRNAILFRRTGVCDEDGLNLSNVCGGQCR